MPRNRRFSDEEVSIVTTPLQIPIHALYASRAIYGNYPPFQRNFVWPDDFKFDLIDSYLRGLPIDDIWISDRLDGEPGKWVLDGQQRMLTILQFMAALYADKNKLPIPRDENGRHYFYERLTERQEEKLLNAIVNFRYIINVNEEILSLMFLRVQNQVPLSPAEKLYAANSAANKLAREVYKHPYFNAEEGGIYTGRVKRRQPFQMATYAVALETRKPFIDLSSTRTLSYISSDSKDDIITDDMLDTINRRMDQIMKLFSGVQSAAKTEIIIQYEAVYLLEMLGANFEQTPEGALVPWYQQVKEINSDLRGRSFLNLFAQFINAKTQKQYWQKWLEQIVYSRVIAFDDPVEADAQLQRVTGWLRNNGICPYCHSMHVRLADIKHHIFRETDRHRPGQVNCYTASLRAVPQMQAV